MKNFRIKLVLFLLLILGLLVAVAAVFGKAEFLFTQIVLGVLLLIAVWQLFYTIDTTNRKLGQFLLGVNYNDHSLSFQGAETTSFQKLYEGMNHSLRAIADARADSTSQELWLDPLIQRMPLGVLVVNGSQGVELMNDKATTLLQVPATSSILEFDKYQEGLVRKLQRIPSEQEHRIRVVPDEELSVYKVDIKSDQHYEIIFLRSIEALKGELEMEAWMRLIRVLTHEIMNSITSISSLAATLSQRIAAEGLSEDMQAAAHSIEKRSKSLVTFTESYRQVSDIRAANKSWFQLSRLVNEQASFLGKQLDGIKVELQTDNEQTVWADKEQIEQVILNLFLNAHAALSNTKDPCIRMEIAQENKYTRMSFSDNGIGISAKEQNQIFIPFYSTRKDGRGIGLSLARQLMRNNQGRISLKRSVPGETRFELRLDRITESSDQ